MHHRAILCQPVRVRDWEPVLPAGTLRSVMLHWTAGDYATIFPAYHFCLTGAAQIMVQQTHDLRANMRELRTDQSAPAAKYAAHTFGRNSYAAGIAICGMGSATPHDFGAYPLTPDAIEGLCIVAAALMRFYAIPIDNVRTHAEAALDDGYFGADDTDARWDIARLKPAPQPLHPAEATAIGEQLRTRIQALI